MTRLDGLCIPIERETEKKEEKKEEEACTRELKKKFAYESKALASGDLLLLRHFVPSELNPSEESADYNLFRKVVLWGSLGLLLCICLCLCSIRILWRESIDWSVIFVMFFFCPCLDFICQPDCVQIS